MGYEMTLTNIRKFKPGDRLSSRELNDIVDTLRKAGFLETGYRPAPPPKTLFYTQTAIPAYSIFPVLKTAGSSTAAGSYRAQHDVEQYQTAHADQGYYRTGYFGTNGQSVISAGSAFYGHIITDEYDFPVKLSAAPNDSHACGFSNAAFTAAPNAFGLEICGQTSFDTDVYFVRKAKQDKLCEVFCVF